MPATASEAYLHALAERTFLKLWAIPNPFRAPGKELSDLLVVFGNDVIVFSDKGCRFELTGELGIGWRRWRRQAVDASADQLGGALRRLGASDSEIYLDSRAAAASPLKLPDPAKRRFHLVAIARPDLDPARNPPGWEGLACVGKATGRPFEVEPMFVGGNLVHVFDGATIDLLLDIFDTAPDLIGYLAGRERAIRSADDYAFREPDLIAEAVLNWNAGSGLTAAVPPLSGVRAGSWDAYADSDRAARTRRLNGPSRSIDKLIDHFHSAYRSGGFLTCPMPEFERHELALRLLAGESRFARRMIVAPFHDLLAQEDQSVPYLATVESPRRPGLRYVWLTYPDPPGGFPPDEFEKVMDAQLGMAILNAHRHFPSGLIVGIAVPNRKATETVYGLKVFDAANWTAQDEAAAAALHADGLFGPPVRADYEHVP